MYKPKDITDFEYSALLQLQSQYKDDPILSDVNVEMKFYILRDKDVDNLATTILDCLQNAEVFKNDKQVVKLTASKHKITKADGDESADIIIKKKL